jgi:hypothetical protein
MIAQMLYIAWTRCPHRRLFYPIVANPGDQPPLTLGIYHLCVVLSAFETVHYLGLLGSYNLWKTINRPVTHFC